MTYNELYQQIIAKKSFLCVGLDTSIELIPKHLLSYEYALFEFNKAIVDATAKYSVAYKPNTAFYEAEGSAGWKQLEMTVEYIRSNYPEIMIIADAKRGDIGNTASRYASAFFSKMDCDAVTLAPYMGEDSVRPFLEHSGKWAVILALTSNKSADDFETGMCLSKENLVEGDNSMELNVMDQPLYKKVISNAMNWGTKENTMFVVGATRPEMIAGIRRLCPDHFLLVPGVGAQGGSVEEVAKYGLNSHCGLLINSSRGIIYADNGEYFAQAAATATSKLAASMAKLLNVAGRVAEV